MWCKVVDAVDVSITIACQCYMKIVAYSLLSLGESFTWPNLNGIPVGQYVVEYIVKCVIKYGTKHIVTGSSYFVRALPWMA